MIKKVIIILYVVYCITSISYAAIDFREIMYNPEGSDTNKEWIEIYNNGDPVDISEFYLYENDIYHGLYPDNFSTLGNGERALIVKDIPMARSELGSNINYIKSSFSLNNTGESLIIADNNKDSVSSYTYNPETGGNGDGNSIQLIGSSWISGIPTPGNVNTSTNNSTYDNLDDNNKKDENYIKPYYKPIIEVPSVVLTKTDFNILAEVTYISGSKRIRKLGGHYYINFGDGQTLESDERINTNFNYINPGNYVVVFEYYRSKLAFDSGEDPDAFLRKNISVINNNVEIIKVDSQNSITIKNDTNLSVDLSSWKIILGDYKYIFPRYSFINKNEMITITADTLGFSPVSSSKDKIYLISNADEIISSFPNNKAKKYIKLDANLITSQANIASNNKNNIDHNETIGSDFFGNSKSYLEQYLDENPNKLEVDFGERNLLTADALASNNKQTGDNRSILYALGSLILILGAARFSKHKNDNGKKQKKENFGTIEIIE